MSVQMDFGGPLAMVVSTCTCGPFPRAMCHPISIQQWAVLSYMILELT